MPSAEPRRRDRRRARHEATKQEILDVAWAMVRASGLNALSLRALAHALDMEPQSLYTYFPSKHAVYDHLFAAGNRELLDRFSRLEPSDDPRRVLRAIAHLFVRFAADEPARYELLFMRTVPDFEPSPESYALAVEVFARGRSTLAAVGLDDDADFDMWTALVAGLASQQLANDPDGDRYVRLIDDAVAMFADHVFGIQPAESVNGSTSHHSGVDKSSARCRHREHRRLAHGPAVEPVLQGQGSHRQVLVPSVLAYLLKSTLDTPFSLRWYGSWSTTQRRDWFVGGGATSDHQKWLRWGQIRLSFPAALAC